MGVYNNKNKDSTELLKGGEITELLIMLHDRAYRTQTSCTLLYKLCVLHNTSTSLLRIEG